MTTETLDNLLQSTQQSSGGNVFERALEEATQAADIEASNWLQTRITGKYLFDETTNQITDLQGVRVNPMLDMCGGAYIELKDRRTKFAKYLKGIHGDHIWNVPIKHKFGGWQDMGLREAAIRAAYDVLTTRYGIKGLAYKSYID